jgi:hypothetical protein
MEKEFTWMETDKDGSNLELVSGKVLLKGSWKVEIKTV